MYYQIWNGIFVKTKIALNLPLTTHTNFQKDYPKQGEDLGFSEYPLSWMIFSWEYFSRYYQANISTKYFMRQKSVLHRVAQYFVHCGHLVHRHSRLSKPFTFSQKMFSHIFHWALKIHALYLIFSSWHILIFNRNWAISNLLLLIFGHQWPIHWYIVIAL